MKILLTLPVTFAFSPVDEKHAHISSWITQITGQEINLSNYGCYCFQSSGLIGSVKHEPVDQIDEACKAYRNCITCHNYRYYDQVGEGCSYDEHFYDYDIHTGCEAEQKCQLDLCRCDKRLADRVAELFDSQYEPIFRAENGFTCGMQDYDDPMMKTGSESYYDHVEHEDVQITGDSQIIQNIISASKIQVEEDSQEKITEAMEKEEEKLEEESIQSIAGFRPMLQQQAPLKTASSGEKTTQDALNDFSNNLYGSIQVESTPLNNSFLDSLSTDIELEEDINESTGNESLAKTATIQKETDNYELQCCGESPDWQVFNSANADCCTNSIFNPVNKECCDGHLTNPGTCF